MKKVLSLLFVVVMIVLAGCVPTSNQPSAPIAAPAQPTAAPVVAPAEPTAAPAAAPAEPTAAPTAVSAVEAAADCSMMPAPTLAEGMLKPMTKTLPLTIAYVPNVMNTHYEMVLSGIKEQIERYGGEKFAKLLLQVPTSNTTSIQEQSNILENLVEQKVDAIFLATESEEAEMPYMKKATEAGIPVFLFNMAELRPDDPYYVTMVGYDQKHAGYLIGEWAVKHFGDKPTKTAILEGFPGVVNSMRLDGFKCAIAGHDNFNIAASQVADWTRAKGQEVTENLLTAHPDINFLFGLYDEMALGAITAIKERGLIQQIAVAGYDNTKDANASIKAGEMMVTVDTAAKEMGVNLVKALNTFMVDGKSIDRITNSELVVYDQANIGTFNEENYIYVPRQPEASAVEASADCSMMPAPTLAEGMLKPMTKTLPLTIAYVPNVMNTHYEMVLSGIKEQIERYGGEKFAKLLLQVPTSNTTSIQEQSNILENLVEQKVDAIFLATESEEAEMPYMKKATEAGIPVFLFNMAELRPDDPYYVTMVGYDQKHAGYLIGEWAVKHFGDKPTKTAILEGFPGVVNSMRLDGFKCAIAGHDNFNIAASQVADWTRAKGQEVTENLLTAHPDINFLFGLYDEMALGAITAIKERGLMQQIAVAGYDNTKDANASIKAGEMMVTVDTAAKEMGVNLVKALNTFMVDGKSIDRITNSELVVYDQANIGTFNEENYIYVPRQPEQ